MRVPELGVHATLGQNKGKRCLCELRVSVRLAGRSHWLNSRGRAGNISCDWLTPKDRKDGIFNLLTGDLNVEHDLECLVNAPFYELTPLS